MQCILLLRETKLYGSSEEEQLIGELKKKKKDV